MAQTGAWLPAKVPRDSRSELVVDNALYVGMQGATSRQPVEVRGVDSFSSSHAVDPIVQIVDCDEQYVGAWLLRAQAKHCKSKQRRNESFLHWVESSIYDGT